MKNRFRWSGWVAPAALLILAFAAWGDEPKSSPLTGKHAPESAPKLTLEEVLQNWQQAQSKINRVDARFSSIVYDDVFMAAIVGQGLVSVDRDGRSFFEMKPDAGAMDKKTIERGSKVYGLVPAHRERWHWTGLSIIKVDDVSRQYELVMIPAEDRFRNRTYRGPRTDDSRPPPPALPEDVSPAKTPEQSVKILRVSSPSVHSRKPPTPPTEPQSHFETVCGSVLAAIFVVSVFSFASQESRDAIWTLPVFELYWARPFLLDPRPNELRTRYMITLAKQSATDVQLEFEPKNRPEMAQCKRVYLILDRSNYKPKALKIEDANGNKSQVFILSDVQINQHPTAPFDNLNEPDLKGYKRMNYPQPTARRSTP